MITWYAVVIVIILLQLLAAAFLAHLYFAGNLLPNERQALGNFLSGGLTLVSTQNLRWIPPLSAFGAIAASGGLSLIARESTGGGSTTKKGVEGWS